MLIFVKGRNKHTIEDYFDTNYKLETMLRPEGKGAQAGMIRNILSTGIECIFVRKAKSLVWVMRFCVRNVQLVGIPLPYYWPMIFLRITESKKNLTYFERY